MSCASRISTIQQLSVTALLLLSITNNIVYAKSTISESITMDDAIYYAKTGFKVLFACSPVLLIAGILVFAREDEEEEAKKRKIKCARS